MRVLVIGATGLLGKEIAALLSEEHDVVKASRSSPEVSVDLSDKNRFWQCTNNWARSTPWSA